MTGFSATEIPVLLQRDGDLRLSEPVRYTGSQGDTFEIPAGFVTDLASVPRIFTALTPVSGRIDPAAILHDWLCTQLAQGTPAASPVDTDGLFRRVMVHDLDINPGVAWLYWGGVRWGALASSYRRQGWWQTFPQLLLLTVLLLPLVLPLAAVTGTVLLALWPFLALAGLARRAQRTGPVSSERSHPDKVV